MRVLLVEDEPAALRALTSIIERRCEGFEIAGTAENGAEGLEKARLLKPDIVITDVKMPVMDGIKLLSRMKTELPSIQSIIVSGHQDFEYARSAIHIGVVDYLLKPVSPLKLKAKLDVIRRKLSVEHHAKRIRLLEKVLGGTSVDAEEQERYLPYHRYLAAILRRNGLPSRFHPPREGTGEDTAPDQGEAGRDEAQEGVWVLPGRDDAERLVLGAADLVAGAAFRSSVEGLGRALAASFHTIACCSGPFLLRELPVRVRNLRRTLDHRTVIGFTQVLQEVPEGTPEEHCPLPDESVYRRFDALAANALAGPLREELAKLLADWERDRRPQIWVEAALRPVLHRIARQAAPRGDALDQDLEFLLDDAVCSATSFSDLADVLGGIVRDVLSQEHPDGKVDTPAFFDSIVTWLVQNLPAAPTLSAVCSRFGVSQTYLSRLFRKYRGISFNDCLTELRIERAKSLIRENPAIRLKEVAEAVGYNDQFYLSRVFKSLVGVSPSEFARGAPGTPGPQP